jgi:hypothetical protein
LTDSPHYAHKDSNQTYGGDMPDKIFNNQRKHFLWVNCAVFSVEGSIIKYSNQFEAPAAALSTRGEKLKFELLSIKPENEKQGKSFLINFFTAKQQFFN